MARSKYIPGLTASQERKMFRKALRSGRNGVGLLVSLEQEAIRRHPSVRLALASIRATDFVGQPRVSSGCGAEFDGEHAKPKAIFINVVLDRDGWVKGMVFGYFCNCIVSMDHREIDLALNDTPRWIAEKIEMKHPQD